MTVLAYDDFDRTGALGSLWTPIGTTFTCDGDKAVEGTTVPQNPPSILCSALMTVAPQPSLVQIQTRRVSAKITRPNLFTSALVEFGLIAAVQTITGGYYWLEVGWRSFPSAQLFARRRSLGTAFPDIFVTAYAWTQDEQRTLRVDMWPPGYPYTANLYMDDVLIGTFPLNTLYTTALNADGIFSQRSVPPVPTVPPFIYTTPAATPLFDRFRVEDYVSTDYSSETAPTSSDEGTLTGVVVSGEGASAATLPINPDSVWDEARRYATRKQKTEGGYLIRFPTRSKSRRLFRFTWRGRSEADAQTLVDFFDARAGGAQLWSYTTPEGEALVFSFAESRLTRTNPRSGNAVDLDAACLEAFPG